MQTILAILRGLVVAAIAFLLLAPVLKLTQKQVEKPILIVGIDNSESLTAKDSAYYLSDYREALRQFVAAFGDQYDVRPYLIGETAELQQNDHFLPDFSAKMTNLSAIFDETASLYANQNVGAMILLTDGLFNAGNNPYYQAGRVPFPVYSVGLGSTEQQTDLLIAGVNHNRQTFKGNFSPIEVKISATKLAGKAAKLTVFDEKEEIFSKNLTISGNNYFETVKFSVAAKEKGVYRYRVVLSELENEITYKNNAATFFIEVVDSREKIAIIYHAPHPDVSAIRQALEKSEKYEISTFSAAEFRQSPADFALLILHQLPSKTLNISNLLSQIETNKSSTLFILGDQTNLDLFNGLQLGVSVVQSKNLFNDAVPAFNDNFTAFSFSETAKKALSRFSPLRTFFGDYKTAVSANVFMYQNVGGVKTNYPLVVFNDFGGKKSGVITGTGLWQWRLYDYLHAQNHDSFDEIVNKMALYLSVKSDRSRFKVMAPNLFNETAPVEFSAELYNESYELISEPDVSITISGEAGNDYTATFSKQNDAYYLNVGELPVGNYRWTASTKMGASNFTKSGNFTVREVELETQNLVADHQLLQNIAQKTNGKFFTINELQDVATVIKENENIKSIVTYNKNWQLLLNSWIYFVILVLLLAAEWFMRKWGGGY